MKIKNYFIDHEQAVALLLLPLLFKRVTRETTRSKSKQTWKPEKEEVAKSVIFFVEVRLPNIN